VKGGVDAVQHKGFARGVEDEDVVAVVGGADAIVLVLVALVVEAEIVGVVLGGLLQACCVGGGIRGECWSVIVCGGARRSAPVTLAQRIVGDHWEIETHI
jgi:hypothetical protein